MGRTFSLRLTIPCACYAQMQHAYDEYNDRVRATGKSRGHFMVDLCRPGHLTACLRNFQEATGCSDENWESQFSVSLNLFMCYLTFPAAM